MMKGKSAMLCFGLLIATAYAENCFTFSNSCGDNPVCSGTGWIDPVDCRIDFCDASKECVSQQTTYNRNYVRTRKKYKRQVAGGWQYCITATHTDTSAGCCTCTGLFFVEGQGS